MRISRNPVIAILTLVLGFNQNLMAQQKSLNDILEENKYLITKSDEGELKGIGLDFLVNEAKSAQFFLIGERRFTEEIPSLISKLHNSIYPLGYHNLALEIGPTAAKELESLGAKDGKNALTSFFSELPGSIPYYDHIQEGQLVLDAIGRGTKIWGIDQESSGSARHIIGKLQALSRNKRQRQFTEKLLDQAKRGFENDSLILISGLPKSTFNELEELFKWNQAAEILIQRLKETKQIFELFNQRAPYQSNMMRNELIKTYFNNMVKTLEGENDNKVMLKVSSLLAGRGKNDIRFFSLGNFVSEYAHAVNSSSFHLLLTGKSHTRGERERKLPELDPELSPLDQLSSNDQLTLFDLKPLRKLIFLGQLRGVPENFVKIIHAYDAVLVLPKLTHALETYE